MRRTVVVVGVGALGSHVVQLVRNVDATIRVSGFLAGRRPHQSQLNEQFSSPQRPSRRKPKYDFLYQLN